MDHRQAGLAQSPPPLARRLALIALVGVAACLAPHGAPAAAPPGPSPEAFAATFQGQLAELRRLVDASLVIRSRTLRVLAEVRAQPEAPLSGSSLQTLKAGTAVYLDLRGSLYHLAEAYEGLLDTKMADLAAKGLTPTTRLKAVMLSLGAALTLYDNYMVAIVLLNDDSRLRRLLNDPDSGFGIPAAKLTEVTLAANSVTKRHRIRQGIAFCDGERARLLAEPGLRARLQDDPQYQYLDLLLAQSPSLSLVRQIQLGTLAARQFDFLGKISADLLAETQQQGVNLVSMFFGNTVGLCESRKGKLYANPTVAADIKCQLRPCDILLEKTPFRLTDKFIPGHFGHVAIWVGNEAELTQAGVWNHRAVRPYRDRIREGNPDPTGKDARHVLEALRDGVALNTLEHFLNVDDVLVLRPTVMQHDPEAVKESLLLAFRQLGKKYDFNFDVNTTDKIVCSELVYVSMPGIAWPTGKSLGRDTISPDQVARLCLGPGAPLELVLLYHDGQRITPDRAPSLLQSLLAGPASSRRSRP